MISLQESSPGVKNDQIRKKLFGKNIQKGEKKNFLFLLVGGEKKNFKRANNNTPISMPSSNFFFFFGWDPQFSLSAK